MNIPFLHHILWKPIADEENIEESIKEMKFHRVQRKGDEVSLKEYDKDITAQ